MADDFYRRQKEREQDHDRAQAHGSSHSTMETYQIEQGEANIGHIPDPRGVDAVPPEPTLIQRLLKLLGLRK
ncbi:MAG: hypothetical protein L6Q98_23945 [Anaerolineae bacterium]|nr:hypothetical protein [Anaerolineae bacterium]NUQ06529.1 hypothetical protein [Anaerolineae bacterium]